MPRSFYFAHFEVFEGIKDYVELEGGIAYIHLWDISVVYIFSNKNKTKYYVNFFVEWDQWSEEAEIVIDIDQEAYLRLMENLKRLFKIEKIEHDVISYGDSAYYVSYSSSSF